MRLIFINDDVMMLYQCTCVHVIENILQNVNKRVKVKVDELEDQLEDVQDLNDGCQIRSENNKMTEIDDLKQQMQAMQRRIEELER